VEKSSHKLPSETYLSSDFPSVEVHNLEIRPASLQICIILQISILHNFVDQLARPASLQICIVLQKMI